jgi:2-phospho-L-lactate guanylyltransferase
MSLWAIIPLKDFKQAKLRLRETLTEPACAALAKAMAEDVLAAVGEAASVQHCLLVGAADAQALAQKFSYDYCDDADCQGLSAAVKAAARQAARCGASSVLVIPGDLPGLRAGDIDELVSLHNGGLTLCAASSDGGSNALLLTPADSINFCYGPDSAAQHLAAGLAAGLDVQQLDLPAFARDIDSPLELEDLQLLNPGPATRGWLADMQSGLQGAEMARAC